MFPCRPQHRDRDVALGDKVVPMRLHACSAGGASFAVASLQVADPAGVTAALGARCAVRCSPRR
jgi:hypothetical protein